MNISRLLPVIILLIVACTQKESDKLTQYVNPLIGSGGHGHVFVGAHVPFGMVQVGPTSLPQEWDWCSGYHQSDSSVIGFSHTHLNGTGIGDLFDVTVMPVVGEVEYTRGYKKEGSGLWSYADRSREITEAGYYSVPLTRYGIKAEMTATERTAMHRYTFPRSKEAAIIIDLENGGCWDRTTEARIFTEGDRRIAGWRYSRGWANNQRVYFVAEFSKPFVSFSKHGNNDMYGRAAFETEQGEIILMKVAISPVSVEGAKKALAAEAPQWNFDKIVKRAKEAWEKELSKIKVTCRNEEEKVIFYTAMYHAMTAPALFCDVDGNYCGADDKIHHATHNTYTIFSLWDTYRAKMPLMSIIQPERMSHFVSTMLNICDEQGRLPVWHLWGCETNCMVGDPGIPVVADAIVKKIKGIDPAKAFEAIEKSVAHSSRGRDLRREHGYIPCDLFNESVAYDMEYAIADGAASLAALAIGDTVAANRYTESSHSYRKLFDPASRFIRGRTQKGDFREPFNPYYSTHRNDDYCEGNAWQYTWLVPHDVEGLAECFGGREAMISKLDSLFTVPSTIEGDPSPDISGLIGQFAHGNEPSHHILYMYNMLGEPHKTAERVREVLSTQYHNAPDGLSGNEDVGQMSAWYILSSLGLYQVEPASGRYRFGSPTVERAEIEVDGGIFTIETINNSEKNIYIKNVWLNGKKYTLPYINHSDLKAGNTLTFEMSNKY